MTPSPGGTRYWFVSVWSYACFYSIALLALDVWTGFHIGLNDFWGAYYQAEHLDFSDPKTLYNGFFPIGYPILIWIAPGDDFIQAGFAIAAACRIALVGTLGTVALRYLPGAWALAVAVAFSILPRVFENVLTPASDLPMMTFALAGGACLVHAAVPEGPRPRRLFFYLAGGALMGLAGLIRQHALVLALGMMLGAVVIRPRDVGRIFLAGLACTLAYSPQFAVNLLAGRGPFETLQYVNIYKIVHGLKELRTIPLDLQPDSAAIIAANPGKFFGEWSRHFFRMLPLMAPVFLSLLYRRDSDFRRLGVVLSIAGLPYLVVVASAWSARAVLPLVPWVVLLAACEVHRARVYVAHRAGTRAVLGATISFVTMVSAVWAWRQDAALVRWYLQSHYFYSEVERALVADGIVHPKQVYTTDGTLYLPMTTPHWPYFDGTWGQFGLYKFAERYPKLDVGTLAGFREDCHRQGVTHVVVDAHSGWVSPMLRDLFLQPENHAEFEYLGRVGGYALFRRRDA